MASLRNAHRRRGKARFAVNYHQYYCLPKNKNPASHGLAGLTMTLFFLLFYKADK